MSKLLIFIGENEKFNEDEIVKKLTLLDGVKNPRKGDFIGAIFECDYQQGKFNTIIRLSDDAQTITVEGSGDESLMVVLKINDFINEAISVVDMDYSFHVELASINNLSELKKKIEDGV